MISELVNYGIYVWPFLSLVVIILAAVLFILNQYKALKAVSAVSRKIGLNDLWFQLIPVFNLYWWFVVVSKLSASFAAEYDRLGVGHKELYPTKAIGIVTVLCYLASLIPFDELRPLASFSWLVCFIVYWVQINNCRKRILANQDVEMLDVEREFLKGN